MRMGLRYCKAQRESTVCEPESHQDCILHRGKFRNAKSAGGARAWASVTSSLAQIWFMPGRKERKRLLTCRELFADRRCSNLRTTCRSSFLRSVFSKRCTFDLDWSIPFLLSALAYSYGIATVASMTTSIKKHLEASRIVERGKSCSRLGISKSRNPSPTTQVSLDRSR